MTMRTPNIDLDSAPFWWDGLRDHRVVVQAVRRLCAPLAPAHAGVPVLRLPAVADRSAGIGRRQSSTRSSRAHRALSAADGRRGALHDRHGRARRRRSCASPASTRRLLRSEHTVDARVRRPRRVDRAALPRAPDEHGRPPSPASATRSSHATRAAACSSLATEACRTRSTTPASARADVDGIVSFMVMHDSVPLPGGRDLARRAPAAVRRSTPTSAGRRRATSRAWPRWRSPPGRPATSSCSGRSTAAAVARVGGDAVPRPRRASTATRSATTPTSCTSACGPSGSCTRRARAQLDLAAVASRSGEYAVRNERAVPPAPARPRDVPGLALRGRAVPCRRLHGRGRRRLRRPRDVARASPRPAPPAGGHRVGRLPRRAPIRVSTSATTCSGTTTPATTRACYATSCSSAPVSARATCNSPRSTTASPAPSLIGLEGLGLCERGASGAFVREGNTRLDGSLPTNTHGGLLSEGYLHGMNTVAEAVLQVQGRGGGDRQAPRHEVCAVTSGALMDGSALILTADR